jgi:hypothetical protein
LVGHVHGSDAYWFLLNQGASVFALPCFPITFQEKIFGKKIKNFVTLAYDLLKTMYTTILTSPNQPPRLKAE